jgi:hypothetical protein
MLPLVLFSVDGCDDPTLSRRPPEITAMVVLLVLDPDFSTQPLLAYPANAVGPMAEVRGEIYRDAQLVSADTASKFAWSCAARYGSLDTAGEPSCIDFGFTPEFGVTYDVRASGDGYPPVSASASVPGDFQVREVIARGSPPGTEELEVRWTPSSGAYRYVVAMRGQDEPRCLIMNSCRQGWYGVTTDTVFSGKVPASELEGTEGPWSVDVYSMNQSAYEYLTTGTAGNLFSVPPVQNVSGGYGAVGAWVRRSKDIEP